MCIKQNMVNVRISTFGRNIGNRYWTISMVKKYLPDRAQQQQYEQAVDKFPDDTIYFEIRFRFPDKKKQHQQSAHATS